MNEDEKQTLFDQTLLPDADSAEAIRYGSAYRFHKNSEWTWSMIEDCIRSRMLGLESQVMDWDFAVNVMKHNPGIIRSPKPPFTARQNRDIFTIADWGRLRNTLDKIPRLRKKNDMWCRKQAIDEYVRALLKTGKLTTEDWKACTSVFNMEPISYDYLRGNAREQLDQEKVDWSEFVDALMGREEQPPQADVIPAEAAEEEPEPVEDLTPLQGYAGTLAYSPLQDVLAHLEDKDEEINAAMDWLYSVDWDYRDILHELMTYSEA